MNRLLLASLFFVGLISCTGDDEAAPQPTPIALTPKEILTKYYWQEVSGGGRVVAQQGQPFPVLKSYDAINLAKNGFYGKVVDRQIGTCTSLGTWQLVDSKTVKLGLRTATIKKLTESEFIYTIEAIEIKRISIPKPN